MSDEQRPEAFGELPSVLQRLAVFATGQWFGDARLSANSLAGGLSGAAVMRLDVMTGRRTGVYILKISLAETEDLKRTNAHRFATTRNPDFAAGHMPEQVETWAGQVPDGGPVGSVTLFSIAGGSLRGYATTAKRGSTGLSTSLRPVISGVSEAWADVQDYSPASPEALLIHVLGDEARADSALGLARNFFGPTGVQFRAGMALVTPANLFMSSHEDPMLRALEHGDFHTGNILVPSRAGMAENAADDFWVIDFDHARDGFFGLDVSYLELSVILDFYSDVDPIVIARCLEHAEHPNRTVQIPDDLQWLADLMRTGRAAVAEFAAGLNGRIDDIKNQMFLARMAQALRWALRHRDKPKSKIALTYAGWYAAQYAAQFEDLAEKHGLSPTESQTSAETAATSEADDAVWEALWEACGHFARRDVTYVLAAESLPREAPLEALGNIPWSAVVDLDPRSYEDGLYGRAGVVLEAERAVHVFSDALPFADFRRGTAWLMNAGWRLRREQPMDFRTWLRTRLRYVRELLTRLRYTGGTQPAVLVVVLGAHADGDGGAETDRVARVIEAFDEQWADNGSVFVVGESDLTTTSPHEYFPLSASALAACVARTIGTPEHAHGEFVLPSQEGTTIVVPREAMNAISEHLDVLDAQVHLRRSDEPAANDAFWRGGRILWSDLAEDLDVQRTVGAALRERVLASLTGHRTQTVVLEHRPGSGGTTAALRCAWDLHWTYPVAVLPSGRAMTGERVGLLADRLQRIFALTDLPVLFVADSADLPESFQDALHRELALRHTRVTTLFVRRSFTSSESMLEVSSPLDSEEARNFLRGYKERTSDPNRIAELELLSSEAYESYRTPFFYGLITFQRDFGKLGDFVEHHLKEVAGRSRDVLEHLCLVSLYSSSGLQMSQILQLLRLNASDHQLPIEDLLGSASALVVQRGGRYRIAHQLLAEKILENLVGSQWQLHLSELAFDFVDDLAGASDDEPTRLLLRQVFIDRMAGGHDRTEDRGQFSPLVEDLDSFDPLVGHRVLKQLAEQIGDEPHFWNHLGRHQIYRLQKDLDLAEEYLDRAVMQSPNDAIHHHTLGLARRARLRKGLRTSEMQGVEAVMLVLESMFDRTVSCFEAARELSPDDIYGYITHVQTIIEAAQRLRNAAKVSSIANLTSFANEWMTEQLTIANSLLDDAVQLYGSLDHQDDYLEKCLADIKKLYGDLDGVVRIWELNNASGKSSAYGRRALAQAYFVRAGRTWRGLTEDQLRRASALAEQNLRQTGAREEDFRLWFEASKLTPGFDLVEAAGHLEIWAGRFPSWRASYYRYVLAFLAWWTERSDDVSVIYQAQEECASLAPGRKAHSYVWLSTDPSWCPLIADSDLGSWDKRVRFWAEPGGLRRVNGVIDVIYGPTQGSISIGDSRVHAFFVPAAAGFMANADENQEVTFYLGFSPAGLRAWDVQRGSDPAAGKRTPMVSEETSELTRPRHVAFAELQAERAATMERSRTKVLVVGLLATASARGNETSLSWLEERVYAVLGVARSDDSLISVRSIVDALPDVDLYESDGHVMIRSHSASAQTATDGANARVCGHVLTVNPTERWGILLAAEGHQYRFDFSDVARGNPEELRRGQVATFTASIARRGNKAIQIELEPADSTFYRGRAVAAADLKEMVVGETRDYLEGLAAQDQHGCLVSELEDHLEQAFVSAVPLSRRLESSGLRQFLHQLAWLSISGRSGRQVASINSQAFFNRATSVVSAPKAAKPDSSRPGSTSAAKAPKKRAAKPEESTPAKPMTGKLVDGWSLQRARLALAGAIADLRWADKTVSLQQVGGILRDRLGEQAYLAHFGDRGLSKGIAAARMGRLAEEKPGVLVIESESGDVREELFRNVYRAVRRPGAEVTIASFGDALRVAVGSERYADLKGRGLSSVLETLPGWRLETKTTGAVRVHGPA